MLEGIGCMEWLNQQEPLVIWNDKGHRPRLKSQSDWLEAGQLFSKRQFT
jgi:hypothetical protein